MQIVLAQANEMVDKVKDLFSRRRQAGIVGAFIKGIDDEENRVLIRKREQVIQTFLQGIITGRLGTLVVFRIKFREKVETRIGLGRELEKNGKEDVAVALFIFVTEITIEIGHRC